jgi:hypothetical protein
MAFEGCDINKVKQTLEIGVWQVNLFNVTWKRQFSIYICQKAAPIKMIQTRSQY